MLTNSMGKIGNGAKRRQKLLFCFVVVVVF